MTISTALEASILRYYHVEKWRVGTIARQLGIHHTTVKRVLAQSGIPKADLQRTSLLHPYLPFLVDTLTKYPTLSASRLYGMVKQRGYTGGPDHFRHLIALYRPKRSAEAYLRLRTLPGEQAQVDWGHFGHIVIGKAKRPLMAFVMVLSFSRQIFLRFYLNAQMANFLRGHVAAFTEWQGVPRVLLYDNLRSAVLERQGDAIRFHPTLLEFAAHYRFEPRPVAIARGNEKGRVERAIRYVRENFFIARVWKDIDDLNAQAEQWCSGQAADRPCPEDTAVSVRETFVQEQPTLFRLPDHPYLTDERTVVHAGKTPYVRFDLNDYSIPHTHVRRTLTVSATSDQVIILDEQNRMIATHPRCYDKAQQIENETHIATLTAEKHRARLHRGQSRLIQAVPESANFLAQAAAQGYPLGRTTNDLLQLLDRYGANELSIALQEALQRHVPHPNAVRLCLERRREEHNTPPPIHLDLSHNKRVHDLVVRPHSLHTYDELQADKPVGDIATSTEKN
jgi:transposase